MKEVMQMTKEKMQKSIHVLEADYASIRAGRANPAVLDKIVVDYYGVDTPINQMAAISVSEARVLAVSYTHLWLVARWRKLNFKPVLDIAALGFLIGQGIGRWGNFVNVEAFGGNTDLPWGMSGTVITN